MSVFFSSKMLCIEPSEFTEYASGRREEAIKEQSAVRLELARLAKRVKHPKRRNKELPEELKTHKLNQKRGEKALEGGEDWVVVNNYYNPDAIEDDDDDGSYEQEEQTVTQGGRTPSQRSSHSAEAARRWRESARQKRGMDGDTVSYQDGRSSGNRSIPSSSRRSIQSRIPQHKESEKQARQQQFEKHVAEPMRAAGVGGEDIYGDEGRYGWTGQQSGSGFCDLTPATLRVFASLDRF
jgi:hypothetical protein